jgi:predicted AAA+ superfamily ATPase
MTSCKFYDSVVEFASMWINRDFQNLVLRSAASRPALVLTGGRQTGKTSLLKHLFPNYHFVSLDLPSEARLAEEDPEAFLRRHPAPLIIDEVQYAPGLFRYLKIVIDRDRDLNGRFLLTGSQKFSLMKAVQESLAGRIDVLDLETLSLHEVQRSDRPNASPLPGGDLAVPDYLRTMIRGGYPELHAKPSLDHLMFYSSFVASYLERDVKGILNVTSLRDFERFLRACALRSGQLLNKADLARDVGISGSTANAWLSVLEASGQCVLLEPWFTNQTKSLVKSPKIYIADTGLLCFLLNIENEDQLARSPLIGEIWETFVFSELRKIKARATGMWKWNYWRDRSKEVDFIEDRGGLYRLFECKWNHLPSTKDAQSILYVRKELDETRVDAAYVIARCDHTFPLGDSILVTPPHDLGAIL